jgi:hypothetical protein
MLSSIVDWSTAGNRIIQDMTRRSSKPRRPSNQTVCRREICVRSEQKYARANTGGHQVRARPDSRKP